MCVIQRAAAPRILDCSTDRQEPVCATSEKRGTQRATLDRTCTFPNSPSPFRARSLTPNLKHAHNELFRRSPDERFPSLPALLQHGMRQRGRPKNTGSSRSPSSPKCSTASSASGSVRTANSPPDRDQSPRFPVRPCGRCGNRMARWPTNQPSRPRRAKPSRASTDCCSVQELAMLASVRRIILPAGLFSIG
jgi:hypothetical protein